ncbi:MAG: VOC family protein, partial [Alphaproteobacteria bacterium]
MEVINHVEIGVSDVEASRHFYEAALAPLGLSLVISVAAARTTRGTARYGFGRDGYPSFWI